MKKTYFICLILTLILGLRYDESNAQTNPVPNYSFENWAAAEGNYSNPVDWNTNNDEGNGYHNITQITPGYNSTYAAQGKIALDDEGDYTQPPALNTAGSGNGFPITQNYNNFEFYYKTYLAGGDVFIASVLIEDSSHNTIGGGVDTITTNVSGFTVMDIDITYLNGNAAASAIITFSMPDNSKDTVSSFIVDDVSLNTIATGLESISAKGQLNVFPVPAHDWLMVKGETDNTKPFQLMLTDATGRVVMERKTETLSGNFIDEEWNLSGIAPGIYSFMLVSDEGVLTRKVVIQ